MYAILTYVCMSSCLCRGQCVSNGESSLCRRLDLLPQSFTGPQEPPERNNQSLYSWLVGPVGHRHVCNLNGIAFCTAGFSATVFFALHSIYSFVKISSSQLPVFATVAWGRQTGVLRCFSSLASHAIGKMTAHNHTSSFERNDAEGELVLKALQVRNTCAMHIMMNS